MSYYLEEHPNTELAQYGWPRTKVSGVIGVHTTESGVFPAGSDPGAENTARYISVRTNHGSYHALADWDTRIKLVRPRYAAWADVTNNAHAMSVSGAMNAARWRDLTPERAAGIVRNMAIAAAELVQDAIADGRLDSPTPARRITAQQAIDGSVPGFYGHGETNPGTRYDPGQNFDWGLFLSAYANAIGGGINFQSSPSEEDDMAYSEADLKRIIAEAIQPSHTVTRDYITAQSQAQHDVTRAYLADTSQNIEDVTRQFLADKVKEASPAEIANLVPADIAQQVIDALAARLGGK